MVEHSPNSVVILDLAGNIIFNNNAFYEYTGYNKDDVNKINIFDYIHPDDVEHIKSKITDSLMGNKIEEVGYRFLNQSGSYMELLTDAVPIKDNHGNIIAILTLTLDMTERYLVDRKHQENMEMHQNITSLSPDAIYIHSAGQLKFANAKGLELVGAKHFSEIAKIPVIDFVHPDYKEIVNERVRLAQKESQALEPLREVFLRLDGSEVNVEVHAKPIVYKGVNSSLLIVRDLTRELEEEIKLRESQSRKAALISAIPDLMFIVEQMGTIVDYNPPAEGTPIFLSREVLGANIRDILPKPVFQLLLDNVQTTIETKNRSKIEFDMSIDGTIREFEARFESSGEIESLVIIREITKRKREEAERLRLIKIESVGLLAGGIAHDFNNILVGILGNINLLQLHENLPKEIEKSLKNIETASLAAKNLTNQLLTFSKGGEPVTKPESIEEIINESIGFVLRGSNSKCITNFRPNLPSVEVEAIQIYQLINNIVINADQAMIAGGIITISVDEKIVQSTDKVALSNGKYIRIRIEDEGPGIDENVKKHIFDPYFTTKPSGSGLGLATSYSIVKRHNGYIQVGDGDVKGTVFQIFLPASEERYVAQEQEIISKTSFHGKVLVLDDQIAVQETLARMLNHLGLECDTALDGREAIEKFTLALQSQPYTFLIMDLTIPGGLGGKEALEEILKIDPSVKAVVSSGYSNDPVMANYKDYGFLDILPKPYSLSLLKEIIRRMMDE